MDLPGNTSWHFVMFRWGPVPPPLLASTRTMLGRIVIRSQLDAARSSAKTLNTTAEKSDASRNFLITGPKQRLKRSPLNGHP
eukprot:2747572-Pyramimonas_sp.AAC.1